MTDTPTELKWFYRCLLLILVGSVSYVIFQPAYNFAHWVPHGLLRNLGVPYAALLYFETNADKLLHPLIAASLVILLTQAKIPLISTTKLRSLLFVFALIVLAEIIQAWIGRGFGYLDLILGFLGCYLAYCLIKTD